MEAAAGEVAKGLTVQPTANSRIIQLSYVSPDAGEAARLVNAFAASYIQLTLDRKYDATIAARDFLEERIATVRDDVNEAERELVHMRRLTASFCLAVKAEKAAAIRPALPGIRCPRLIRPWPKRSKSGSPPSNAIARPPLSGEVNASTAALRQELASVQAEYEEKSTYLQDSFPDMVRLRTRIDELNRQITSETYRSVAALRAEYQAALAEENTLRSRVSQLSSDALSEREIRSSTISSSANSIPTAALYDALLERYNEVSVAAVSARRKLR